MRIITGAEADPKNAFDMPTDAELNKLYRVVTERYPKLALPAKASEERVRERQINFKCAFLAIGSLGRLSEPEQKNVHAMSWWVDLCREWLECEKVERNIDAASFTLAVVAHGDIPYAPLDRWPYDLSFGLQYGGAGKRAKESWRTVLAGQLLPPARVPLPNAQPVRLHASG